MKRKSHTPYSDPRHIADNVSAVLDDEVTLLMMRLGIPLDRHGEYMETLLNLVSSVVDDYIKEKLSP